MKPPAGVILAGGLARRMGGGDKGRLEIGGTSIIEHVVARISGQATDLILNANGAPDRFADLGLPVVPDSIDGFAGPLAGVLAGMDWAAENGHQHIVTVAADTPFLPPDLVVQLQEAVIAQGKPIALAATPDVVRGKIRHPTFGLWPVDLREDLRQALVDGVRKVVAWTDQHGTAMAEFSTEPVDPFFNVNTPDDLELADTLYAEICRPLR